MAATTLPTDAQLHDKLDILINYYASCTFDVVITVLSEWFGGVDVNYRDEFDSAGDADPYDVIDAYTKVNARIGVSTENWELMAYGRNIFDEVAFQQSFDTPVLAGSHTWFMEEGAVFGIRGTFKF